MKLNLQSLGEISADKSILTPRFDIQAVRAATAKEPQWLHIGAGNIFRGFIAGIAQTLLNAGELTRGIIAADKVGGKRS